MVVTSALTACSGYMMMAYYCIVVFRRCPHFELGLVVVVVSVAAVHIGNPGLNSLVALLGRIRNWTALVNLVGVPTMREIWRWAGEN